MTRLALIAQRARAWQRLSAPERRARLASARRRHPRWPYRLPETVQVYCRAGGWWGWHRAHLHRSTWLQDGAIAHAERLEDVSPRGTEVWVSHTTRGEREVGEVLDSVQAAVLEQLQSGAPLAEALRQALEESNERWKAEESELLRDVWHTSADDAAHDRWRDEGHA